MEPASPFTQTLTTQWLPEKKSKSTTGQKVEILVDDSHDLKKDQEEFLKNHLKDQFDALKALITLFLTYSIESNITREFDTTDGQDKTLHMFLSRKIEPMLKDDSKLNLIAVRENLHQQVQDYNAQMKSIQTLIEHAKQALDVITTHIIPVCQL